MRSPLHPLQGLLEALPPARRDAVADGLATRAQASGLVYLGASGRRPIPVAFPPVIEPRDRTRRRSAIAQGITRALASAATRILDGALGAPLADDLLGELAPIEREIVAARYRQVERLATVRADLFVDPSGVDRLLEINATIPAMQGYSDIAAQAFVHAVLDAFGRDEGLATEILAANGSNAADLLASIVACHRAEGGTREHPSIALVHRRDDSQLGELEFLASRFRDLGHDARTVIADDVALTPAGRACIGEFSPDVLYRHVFATRVDPATPIASILRKPDGHSLFNPVDPHLEQKGMLAELSAASVDGDRRETLDVSADDAALVRAHVPWTRRLRGGPSTDAAGRPIADLVAHVRDRQASWVIKRSWDFGGKGVFLGAEYGDEGSRTRAGARFGAELSWSGLVDACASEAGWVVQERVPLVTRPLWIASTEGAREVPAFVDVSAYTNLGVSGASPSGGVCRASSSAIVNIQSGGGVVPLLSAEAADRLFAAITG